MSSANFVCPVHLARASTLRKGLPTTFRLFLVINQIKATDKHGLTRIRKTAGMFDVPFLSVSSVFICGRFIPIHRLFLVINQIKATDKHGLTRIRQTTGMFDVPFLSVSSV